MDEAAIHRRHRQDGLGEAGAVAELALVGLEVVVQAVECLVPDLVGREAQSRHARPGVDGVVDQLVQGHHGDEGRSSIPRRQSLVAHIGVRQRAAGAAGEAAADVSGQASGG